MAYIVRYNNIKERLRSNNVKVTPQRDRSPTKTPPSPIPRALCPTRNTLKVNINYLLLQFQESPSLFPDHEHYQTETIAFLEPAPLITLLKKFENDHPTLQRLCLLQYATEMTTSLARAMFANRIKGIFDSHVPFVVNIVVLNKEDRFIPLTEAQALPTDVKIFRRGDRTTHLIIRLVYIREAIRYYNNDSVQHRYQNLLNTVLIGNGAWGRF